MPDSHVITSFLGFQSHVVVRHKRHRKSWVEIWLEPRASMHICSACGWVSGTYYDRVWIRLRDLKTSKHRVLLWVPNHRVECPRCDGVRRERLSIARPHARCTRRFERELFHLTEEMTVKGVSKFVGVDWRMVKDAEIRYILGLLRKRNLDDITELGIDEVSEKKGHRYLTLVTDITKRRVIWVGRGNDGAVLRKFFHWFGPKRTRRLKIAVIDMHDPYLFELRKRCRAKIIFDRFHVVKPLHMAIDKIRCRLYRELPPEGRRYIKNSRFLLLRHREDLSPKQSVRLEDLLAVNDP